MVWDLILYIALGVTIIVLTVWGIIVSLPDSNHRQRHISVIASLGGFAAILTIFVGFRAYDAQKESVRLQSELSSELKTQTDLLVQTKSNLDQVRLEQVKQQTRTETLDDIFGKWSNDNNKNMQTIGEALSGKSQWAPSITNRFHSMSAQELKNEAIGVSQHIRSIESSIDASVSALSEGWTRLKTPQERDEYSARMAQLYTSLNPQYQSCCKDLAIALREEILERENGDPSSGKTLFEYENPTNPYGLEIVASDLEKLALSIPDKTKRHR